MSAYLCDAAHLSALVNAAMNDRYITLSKFVTPESAQAVHDELLTWPEAMYSDLLQTNLESLAARYPDSPAVGDWTTDEGSYRLDVLARFGSPVEVIKGAQCYQYQACEHDGWETSKAKAFTDQLISSAINSLPGYDTAAWGFADPRVAAND